MRWLNSTPGVLAALISAAPKKLVYPQMPLKGQRSIPLPDLTGEQAARLAGAFDVAVARRELAAEPAITGRRYGE